MPTLSIHKPSQFCTAMGEALRATFPELKVGSRQDLAAVGADAWVLIALDGDASGIPANDGRHSHALSVSLQCLLPGRPDLEACDLAAALLDFIADQRWGISGTQCDLPTTLVAQPSTWVFDEQTYNTWAVSFVQTLYFGQPLLEGPTGIPLFARTWEVSDIDDPAQYTALEG
ncbi:MULTISPECIES: hypothetical protein [Pseudomonas]|uniref:hypothetical protein n=1 Tax=Pseudomonas TaxID=286 RepID=UPI001BEC1629|nr:MULTISPECIES: hypothetical protein [Pseudomonas]MBT2340636.1 hypothetical protein [Pseudomonas fluorescens]MCD4531913.1 hypothetical protein [Pseudomonas sp. C3-2018]